MPKRSKSTDRRPGLKVIKRGSSYYLQGTIRGRRIREAVGTDNAAIAEEARVVREAELLRAAIHGTKETVTFAQAALDYLSRPADGRPISAHSKMALGRIAKHFGPKLRCDQIDQRAIDLAGRALCPNAKKAVTIHRAVTTPVRAVLNYAARRGWCPVPNFETAKGGGKRTDWFTPAEANAMIAAAADHLRPLLTFLFCTGARMGEAVALDWSAIDLGNARAVLRETKNGDDRIVDLCPRVVAALSCLPGERTGRVFLCPVGNPKAKTPTMAPYRLSGDNIFGSGGGQIKRSWATALKASGIARHLTPHHTRHSWATWKALVYDGNLLKLKHEGGWRSITMCERYAKLAPDGMRGSAEAFFAGGATQTKEKAA